MDERLYQLFLDWCIVKYGKSKYYDDYPDLEIDYDATEDHMGSYDDENNVVIIFHLRCRTSIYQSITTIIHEYQHYLQGWTDGYNEQLEDILDVEAEQIAIRDWEECFKDIFNSTGKRDEIYR